MLNRVLLIMKKEVTYQARMKKEITCQGRIMTKVIFYLIKDGHW